MSFHNRTNSASSDGDPFDIPEKYYGINTDPATAKKNSKFGRVRTFSVFEPKSSSRSDLLSDDSPDDKSNPTSLNASSVDLHSPSSDDIILQSQHAYQVEHGNSNRRPSIVPIYNQDSPFDDAKDKLPNPLSKNPISFRRASLDDSIIRPKKFYINDIDLTLKELLENEDTDHNYQITIEDTGPKVLKLGTANSNGFKNSAVRGTYMLSNLLQELTIAKSYGRNQLIIDEDRLCENPVKRLKRLISTQFWKALTREITEDNIVELAKDTKIVEEYTDENGEYHKNRESIRIYIPHDRSDQYDFFMRIKQNHPQITLDVQYLPEKIDGEYIKSINKKPGLLSLASHPDPNNPEKLIFEPYVVPGGRFNELYGWDSYMIVIGLLVDTTPNDHTYLRLARGMTESFIYEIKYYGKILNANRSYYLGRSQPPFLTDMALRVFNKWIEIQPESLNDGLEFLQRAVLAAITEYETVWCCKPRLDEKTQLSCYHPIGVGVPPETEPSHFNAILKPYREKYNLSQLEFIEKYNNHEIDEPDLDEYFLHDRAVRESGHDTSYRLEGKCAHLATVDLNSLLYKYEVDISFIIDTFFHGELKNPRTGVVETPSKWDKLSKNRRENINRYLWNDNDNIYYDYNVVTGKQTCYESATCFWPLWSKAATTEHAKKLVTHSLSKFEEFGGLVSGTLKSRGGIGIHRPSRQWDYPYGWAPQQILAWIGLSNYGFDGIARRLVYRWLFMMIRAFVDYNGVVVEKYNVVETEAPHKVDAEYGNQGADFKGVAKEGFGWVNASFEFGLSFLNLHAERNLGTLTPPDVFMKNLHESQKDLYS